MSYILDALKKAERERGIRQVPTLMTDHAPHVADRKTLGIGASLLAVCLLAAGWYFLYSRQTATSPSVGTADPTQTESAGPGESARTEASLLQSPEELRSGASEKTPSRTTAPVAIVPESSIRKQPIPAGLRTPLRDDEVIPDDEDYENLPPREIIRSVTRTSRESAPPEPPKSRPVSLKEAVSQMTLSLLVYSDVSEERMVFINGSRYKEGDYVEEVYLLERITEEGALLTYEGARALLTPRPR
ncbi:MAG: general secretion pathway protein GspB [Acidobacteriota bacterium]|nr:general secretion pathway protein GspB [Acidobacteriota bacterium]